MRGTLRTLILSYPINRLKDQQTIVKQVVHELGHWIEDDPEITKMAQAFWEERTGNEKYESMRELVGDVYTEKDLTKVDEFIDPYMGISYWNQGNAHGNQMKRHDLAGSPDTMYGSEMVSRSLDLLYENPLQLIDEDSHHFEFLWKVVSRVSGKN